MVHGNSAFEGRRARNGERERENDWGWVLWTGIARWGEMESNAQGGEQGEWGRIGRNRDEEKEDLRTSLGTEVKERREGKKEEGRRVVRAKRMTAIRPIIGWHQKCWVWLACQMGNSRRTAEASYSRLWPYVLCVRTVGKPTLCTFFLRL
ncbi:hypothetical protein KM043_007033 [Ampulex compressa]|nr:hypothetical protein KM043_007033 [Ampulex compressa]